MTPLNLHQRVFVPVRNSEDGTVTSDTIFVFRQDGNDIIANYSGGTVKSGHLMGVFETDSTARIVYHCLTLTETLKTGQAIARFSDDNDGKLAIDMDWQWLSGDHGKGQSHYKELRGDA